MSKSIKTDTNATLVKDIAELYTRARQALVESYWQIGKRIVEQEQQGRTNAVYGKRLIARLSEDLSQKLGGGFSVRNLYRMRNFFLAHKILPPPAKLSLKISECPLLNYLTKLPGHSTSTVTR